MLAKFACVFQPHMSPLLNIYGKLHIPVEEANISFCTKEGSQDITRPILRPELSADKSEYRADTYFYSFSDSY